MQKRTLFRALLLKVNHLRDNGIVTEIRPKCQDLKKKPIIYGEEEKIQSTYS